MIVVLFPAGLSALLPAALMLSITLTALPASAGNEMVGAHPSTNVEPPPEGTQPGPACRDTRLLMAEGSNSCEIVSCGMGIKDTCKITCPQGKTPKCSCDCLKSFGPMCTEYKANCKCE